jgi:GntR family transcriptional repressor for pyruvate dehydrogenase complex
VGTSEDIGDQLFGGLTLEQLTEREPPSSILRGGAIERLSLAEVVANRLMALIKSGTLRAGDRLPTEAQMALAFGISRAPLREALKALTVMGLINSRQGGRYSVSDLSSARLLAPFNVSFAAVNYDAQGHFEARSAVDLELVRLASLRATDAERSRIVELAIDGRNLQGDQSAFRLLDVEFHESINVAAHNPLLATIGRGLYNVGLEERRRAFPVPGVIDKSVEQHFEIATLIAEGKPDEAVGAYRRHLEHVRSTALFTIETNMREQAERQPSKGGRRSK